MNTLVMWDDALLGYDMGDHPLDPVRVELTMALARELGVLDRAGVRLRSAGAGRRRRADPRARPRLHRRGAGRAERPVLPRLGPRHPRQPGLRRHARGQRPDRGATLRRRRGGLARRGRPGGQHRRRAAPRDGGPRRPGSASTTTRRSRSPGCSTSARERVAYVDIDVHHGDGVQAIFYDDPRVLTVSLHETPLALFPGTGFPDETGGPGAEGTAVNVALPPGTGDAGWLRAFHAVVPSVLRAFRAAAAVHPVRRRHVPARPAGQPAADGRRAAGRVPRAARPRRRAVRAARWVATGGGGYALVEVRAPGLDAPAGHGHRRRRSTRHADPAGLAGAGRRAGAPAPSPADA